MNDAWLKLHTSLLTSAKYVNLPSNDHRVAFISLLLLAKKRLENAPEEYISAHVFLSKRRWKTVRKDLISCGLLDEDGSVKGFEESQLSPEAIRKRRERGRDVSRTNGVTCHGQCHDRGRSRSRSREEEGGSARARAEDTPPSREQKSRIEEMAAERGMTVEQVAADIGVRTITKASVTGAMDYLRAIPKQTPEQAAAEARSASARFLVGELEAVHQRDGPQEAAAWVKRQEREDHDPEVIKRLRARLTTLNNEQEAKV